MTGIKFISLMFVNQVVCTVAKECPESALTRQVVRTCPSNFKEYKERANEKKCENIKNSCSSFVYHCVLDTYLSFLQEVCAPNTVIIGRKCAEWNVGGQSIQSSKNRRGSCSKFENNPCPLVYMSANLYKFPGCYNLTQRSSPEETTIEQIKATTAGKDISKPESFPIWLILLIIIAVIVVISILIIAVIAFRKQGCHDCRYKQNVNSQENTDNGFCPEDEGLLDNLERSNDEINEDVTLQPLETCNSAKLNGDVNLPTNDDVQKNGKNEVPSPDTQKVDAYKNFLGKEYHDKIRKRRGRKRYQSESSATESEQINKYEEYKKLIEEASNLHGEQRSNEVVRNPRRLSSVEEENTYSKKMIFSSLAINEKVKASYNQFPRRKRRITA